MKIQFLQSHLTFGVVASPASCFQSSCIFDVHAFSISMVPCEIFGPFIPKFERLEVVFKKFFWLINCIDACLSHRRVVMDSILDVDLMTEALRLKALIIFEAQLLACLCFPLLPLVHDLCTVWGISLT